MRAPSPTYDPPDPDSETRQRAAAPTSWGKATLDEARALHRKGEHEAALFLLGELLQVTPHPEAAQLSTDCRAALEQECLAVLGPEAMVLRVAVAEHELRGMAIDHAAAFLVSLVDGATTLESILDIAAMPRLVALRHLRSLRERGILASSSDTKLATTQPPPPPLVVQQVDVAHEDDPVPLRLTIPSFDAVPVLLVGREELETMGLEPHARLLANLVDDGSSVETILGHAKLNVADGMAMLERLASDGVLAFV